MEGCIHWFSGPFSIYFFEAFLLHFFQTESATIFFLQEWIFFSAHIHIICASNVLDNFLFFFSEKNALAKKFFFMLIKPKKRWEKSRINLFFWRVKTFSAPIRICVHLHKYLLSFWVGRVEQAQAIKKIKRRCSQPSQRFHNCAHNEYQMSMYTHVEHDYLQSSLILINWLVTASFTRRTGHFLFRKHFIFFSLSVPAWY